MRGCSGSRSTKRGSRLAQGARLPASVLGSSAMKSVVEAQWRELSPLLDDLLELPEEQRLRWLEDNIADAERRALLERLLSDALAPGVLDLSLSECGAVLVEEGLPQELIDRASPYRLLELIGEGGMASVYRATREGGEGTSVAVKIMRVGLLDQYERERFSRERRILARLEH